ncbi:MAG TPA: peptidoglycan editing factor PgeF [Candidatus Omnitrophota bacterium]|nr:peptidoglycan editing factor PgeF [Candidatus Omnitrophota bacterium]HPS36771.1 peptidoglycan editing factor PgeF [Candidatus Omnitrophota bacterium]
MIFQENPAGIFRVEILGPGVCAAFSSRTFDNSRREEYLRLLSLDPRQLVMVKQVHGSGVLAVKGTDPGLLEEPADGLITGTPGLVLGIRTADCVPVFFWDASKRVAGIAHGGWKGVKAGIISRMLNGFEREFGTDVKDLKVVFGPSIRKCCYEVGKEFLGHFPGFYRRKDASKGLLDLVGVIRDRLVKRGVPGAQIHDTGLCTVCRNETFFSYRNDSQTQERILNIISILPA